MSFGKILAVEAGKKLKILACKELDKMLMSSRWKGVGAGGDQINRVGL